MEIIEETSSKVIAQLSASYTTSIGNFQPRILLSEIQVSGIDFVLLSSKQEPVNLSLDHYEMHALEKALRQFRENQERQQEEKRKRLEAYQQAEAQKELVSQG